jgi:rSAM/selenodomain-associated transferase 2
VQTAVVIPALDEAGRITEAVRRARETAGDAVEVVVVDGGSRDDTPEQARAAGATLIASAPGRARQLAAGVAATRAEVVLFLHADTTLPPGWDGAVRRALAEPGVVGGAFRFSFARGEAGGPAAMPGGALSPSLAWVELGARLRVALFRLPYGDQAIFATRAALAAIGGVPQVPLMEDLDLVRALQGAGRFVLLRETVATSPRRYQAGGPLRTMARHWLAAAAWALGVDRAWIAAWYARAGRSSAVSAGPAPLPGARSR